jgi:peptidyl-prolyl cis-trans isomerase D
MLRGLRNASNTLFGKAIMASVVGLLIIAFGYWGIADVFRNFGRSTVARIGGTEITIDQFRNIFNERLQQVARQVNRVITPEQARAFGFDRQLLGEMMAEAALDDRAAGMGLGVSDAEIARMIREDPMFRGLTGQFDQSRFSESLAAVGYNEQRYVDKKRHDVVRDQLRGAVTGGITAPKVASDIVNRFQNEERVIDFVKLDRSKAGNIPDPTPEQLTKYFDANKALFRAPEYRKVIMLTLTPEDAARNIEVSDADAQKSYDIDRDKYGTPERRQVQQIVFPNADDAKKAADRINAGTSFDTVVSERGLKPQDVDLGLVPKSGILDPAAANAAFSLKSGQVSAPVAGRFGTVLVKVTKIEPEKIKPFAEVKAQVVQGLAIDRARKQLSDLRDKIEDERGGGAKLDEIADKFKLPARTVAIDRSGRGTDGKPLPDFPGEQDVITGAFASATNVDNDPVQMQGDGLIWYEVLDIQKSKERTLDEVKDRVVTSWRDNEIAERVSAKAKDMSEKLKSGSPFKDVAATAGAKVDNAKGLKRRGSEALPASVIEEVFKTPKDGVGVSQGSDPTEQYVFRVTAVTVPPFDAKSADAKRIIDALNNATSTEVLGQYVLRLETDLGATINGAALNQAVGATGGDAD